MAGQLPDDLKLIVRSHSNSGPSRRPGQIFAHGELRPAALGLIRVYQQLISSQDGQVCNFTVSCSRFATRAIEHYGLAHGLAMASDRVQRCNGFSKATYPLDVSTGLAIDLPMEYFYARTPKKIQ